MYKLDEAAQEGDNTQEEMTAVPADVMEGSIRNSNRFKPLPEIGNHLDGLPGAIACHRCELS